MVTKEEHFQADLDLVKDNMALADFIGSRQATGRYHCPYCQKDELDTGFINKDRFFCRNCHRSGDVVDIIRQTEGLTESKEQTAAVLALKIRMDKAMDRLVTEAREG